MRANYLPYSLSIYITYDCHLKCPHCFLVQKNEINRYRLSFETIANLINQAETHGVYTIIIAGGDPLLHPDFLKIVKLIKSKKMIPLVACTGINLNNNMIQKIVKCGIPTLQISLDGATAETHDRIRRVGNYEEVCSAARRIVASGLNLNIALCIHKANTHEVNELFKLCLKLGAYSVKLTFYLEFSPTQNCTQLNSEEIALVLNQAQDFNTHHEKSDWIICPGYNIRLGSLLQSIHSSPDIVVSADGGVSTDEAQPRFGNILEDNLSEIYTRHINNLIRRFFKKKLNSLYETFNITSIEGTTLDLSANALIYKQGEKIHILIDDSLSEPVWFFTALHEIGHIATSTLVSNPRNNNKTESELIANEWALLQLKHNIHPDVLYQYENALFESETALYQLVNSNLTRDLVNFF